MGSAFVEREKLMACVHCGLCLASCPTYLELGIEADSPRGRIHLMRALAEGQLEPTADVIRHLDLCVGCRACETACPSGVRYGALIEAARPFVEPFRSAPARWGRRLLSSILPTRMPWTVALAARRVLGRGAWLGPLARRLGSPWLAYAAALPVDGVARRLPEVIEPAGRARGTAVLLGGCVADALFRQTNVATALLLHRAGVRVLVPRAAGCCGALALHLGHRERARELARRATAALGAPAADWVVSNAAGCGALLREYGELLPGEPAAAGIATRARDALELLGELGLPEAVRPLRRTVAVHDPCHLAHGQGVRDEARRLLGEIPGIRLVELEESDTCCGSAGTYNLTEPTMARRLLDRKLDRIAASGAEVVAAANPGCILQIRAGAILRGLPVAVEHPIDLLATAHGVAGGSHDQAAVR